MALCYKLDEDGEPTPINANELDTVFADPRRMIAEDLVDDARVSTVFLGLNHDWSGIGPPVLWETMIFGGEHDEYQERYTSRAEALEGHKAAVALVRSS